MSTTFITKGKKEKIKLSVLGNLISNFRRKSQNHQKPSNQTHKKLLTVPQNAQKQDRGPQTNTHST